MTKKKEPIRLKIDGVEYYNLEEKEALSYLLQTINNMGIEYMSEDAIRTNCETAFQIVENVLESNISKSMKMKINNARKYLEERANGRKACMVFVVNTILSLEGLGTFRR